ncbi:hypothetical protein ACN47E_000643 [Coniothyrium glycines]
MASTLRVLNVAALVVSLVLTGLSVAEFHLTGHAFKTMATYFPNTDYVWFGARKPQFSSDYYSVRLAYDWSNENFVLASAGVSIAAGVLGMLAFIATRRTPSKWWSTSTLSFSLLSFAISLLSFLRNTLTNASYVKQRTCDPSTVPDPNFLFTCTRELAACNLLESLIEHDFAERKSACQQTRNARWLLVPLLSTAAVLFTLVAVKLCVERKTVQQSRKSADLRVKTLRDMEEL